MKTTTSTTATPSSNYNTINLDSTKEFLSFLSPESKHKELFLSLPTARSRYGTIATHTRWLQGEAQDNLFFLVGNSVNGKRKDSDITSIRAFYIDFDGGERYTDGRVVRPDGSTLAPHLEPSLVVNSKNGSHLYWVLETPSSDLTAFTAMQKSLIAHYSSDTAIHDTARVMRLPGSIHNKVEGEPFMVTWALASGIRYTVEQVECGLRHAVEISKAQSADLRTVADCLLAISGAASGNRNDTLNACAYRIAHIEQDGGRNPKDERQNIINAALRMNAPMMRHEIMTTVDSATLKPRADRTPLASQSTKMPNCGDYQPPAHTALSSLNCGRGLSSFTSKRAPGTNTWLPVAPGGQSRSWTYLR